MWEWRVVLDLVDGGDGEVVDGVEVGEIVVREGDGERWVVDGRIVVEEGVEVVKEVGGDGEGGVGGGVGWVVGVDGVGCGGCGVVCEGD